MGGRFYTLFKAAVTSRKHPVKNANSSVSYAAKRNLGKQRLDSCACIRCLDRYSLAGPHVSYHNVAAGQGQAAALDLALHIQPHPQHCRYEVLCAG